MSIRFPWCQEAGARAASVHLPQALAMRPSNSVAGKTAPWESVAQARWAVIRKSVRDKTYKALRTPHTPKNASRWL